MQNTVAQRQQRREKVTWNPQLHCARKSSRIRWQSEDVRTRRAREPTFLRSGTSVYPKKTQFFVQILTFKSHPWWNCFNAICQEWLAKHNTIARYTGEQIPFKTPWRSHSIAICRHGLEKDNRIATHYCTTHRCYAPVPMHKVPQHMQTTKALQHATVSTVQHIAFVHQCQCTKCLNTCKVPLAQHQTRRGKSHLCARISSKIPRQSDDA